MFVTSKGTLRRGTQERNSKGKKKKLRVQKIKNNYKFSYKKYIIRNKQFYLKLRFEFQCFLPKGSRVTIGGKVKSKGMRQMKGKEK